jgi:alkylmercury lyase
MSTTYIEQTTDLIRRVAAQPLLPHAVRLLCDGQPVTIEALAAAAGASVEDVEAALVAQTSAERDERGRLVGFGLTLRPTAHRFTVGSRRLFAWCASDTLMLPVILGRPAVVDSTCRKTGRPIQIELTPDSVERVEPAGSVVSAIRPAGHVGNLRANTCNHGHFFSSLAATAEWTGAHPDGHIHAVDEAFALDRQVITQLGWAAATRR